jgi:putative MATE family efflux protein
MSRDSIDLGTMNILSLFRKMFIPTLLGMLFTATITIADGIFVGHGVGSDGLAAVNIAAPLFMITTGIGLLFGIGASIVAAIHLSQKNIKAARINITQALIVSSIIMLLISTLVLCFDKEVTYLFGSSDKLLPLALSYIDWLAPSLIFSMMISLGLFIIRLDGSPVFAMLCNSIPAILNIILCYLFVIKLEWGIKGSAIACGIATAIGGIMVMIYMVWFSKTLHFYKLKISRKSIILTIRNIGYMIKLGSSALLGELAVASMMIVGNYVFMGALGEDGVAAFSVACYCFPLVFMINNAIAQSAQPIISYNYGAGDSQRVKKTLQLSVGVALIAGSAATLISTVFCKPLIGLFLNSSCNAYNIAINGIPYFASGFIFFAFNIVIIGYYQSLEKAKRATIYMLLRGFIFIILCFLTLPLLFGEKGIWLSVPCSEMLASIIIISLFLYDKSKKSK